MAFTLSMETLEQAESLIIQGTACTLAHIRDVNDWNSKPQTQKFIGRDIPDLSILDYCERLRKYFRCSPTVYLAALIYIDKYVEASNVTINRLTIHRLLVVSMVISVKFHEDLHYTNAYYAQVGGVDLKEMNQLEREMLNGLNWNLDVLPEHFQQYLTELATHPQLCSTCNPQLCSNEVDSTKAGHEERIDVVAKDEHSQEKASDFERKSGDVSFAGKQCGPSFDSFPSFGSMAPYDYGYMAKAS